MRTIEEMSETEAKALLEKVLECVRSGREAESSEDIGDMVSEELFKAGLDVDAPSSYDSDEDDSDED
jgi:hypothetical protein